MPEVATPPTSLPSDADLADPGPQRSLAYDRAWWFARFVADTRGAPTLRALYQQACGDGHTDLPTAVHDVLGADTRRDTRRLAALADSLIFLGVSGPAGNQRFSASARRHPVLSGGVGSRLAATGEHTLTVYAPQWKDAEAFDADAAGYQVVRHPGTLMLPVPTVDIRMRRLIAERGIDTVWFGAAAPLALLAQRARQAGATRVLASTHGHEVGWSMLPVARSVLRRIGDDTDVVTFVSRYTRGRFASAFGPHAALGAPAARRRHRPVPSRSRHAAPSCAPATVSASGRPCCACRGWCRARARTC